MRLNRKTLHPWIEEHIGAVRGHRHLKWHSGYEVEAPDGKIAIWAFNKKAALDDFTIKRGRRETGFNWGIWVKICRCPVPVRIIMCHASTVYIHGAPDARLLTPEQRYVHGQADFDPDGVAWFRIDDFLDATAGLPGVPLRVAPQPDSEAEPKAPDQPSILDLFNPEGEGEDE